VTVAVAGGVDPVVGVLVVAVLAPLVRRAVIRRRLERVPIPIPIPVRVPLPPGQAAERRYRPRA
jgi:hypothetical protein